MVSARATFEAACVRMRSCPPYSTPPAAELERNLRLPCMLGWRFLVSPSMTTMARARGLLIFTKGFK